MKFLGYMRLQKLKDVILSEEEDVDQEKNEEAFAELIQFMDDRSLSLVMRDAVNDGRAALKILREHYAGASTPRIISLYTELTSLVKKNEESVTDYVIRAETAAAALKNAGETVSDSLFIALILKGLPDSFQSFEAVITQSEKKQNVTEFKVALRSFEETERSTVQSGDSVLKTVSRAPRPSTSGCTSRTGMSDTQNPSTCFKCGQAGHFAKNCKQRKLWCSYCKKNNHTDKSCRYLRNKVGSGRNNVDRVNEVVGKKKMDSTEHSFAFGASTPDGKILERATTHIINDERKFSKSDASFQPEKHFIELANGEKRNNIALKR